MAGQDKRGQEHADEVTARNVAGMRELLAQKQQQHDRRGAEPPLEDDPNVASGADQLAEDPSVSEGNTSGIRNLGGGRA